MRPVPIAVLEKGSLAVQRCWGASWRRWRGESLHQELMRVDVLPEDPARLSDFINQPGGGGLHSGREFALMGVSVQEENGIASRALEFGKVRT